MVHGSDHPSPSSPNIIKQWSYTSTPHICLMVCTVTILPLPWLIFTCPHMYKHTHPTHVCTSKYICTYTYTNMFACAQTPPPHTHTHTHKYTYLFAHAHLCPNTHKHVSLYVCIYNYTLQITRLHKKRKTVMSDAFVLHFLTSS